MKVIFDLPVNTDKPKFVAFLVFLCTTALFIAQISSSENVSKRHAILAPVEKRGMAKDISSYGTQSIRVEIANRDLKYRQRNERRRRFATEADWAKGSFFGTVK